MWNLSSAWPDYALNRTPLSHITIPYLLFSKTITLYYLILMLGAQEDTGSYFLFNTPLSARSLKRSKPRPMKSLLTCKGSGQGVARVDRAKKA